MTSHVPRVGLTTTEYADLADRVAVTRSRFAGCVADIAASDRRPDAIATAILAHLASVTASALPPAAQTLWSDRIARPLKTDPAKPLPARAVRGIASWPGARIAGLVDALAEIEAILVETENEARNEVFYAEFSRAYS